MKWAAVLLMLALAGCLGGSDDAPAPEAPAPTPQPAPGQTPTGDSPPASVGPIPMLLGFEYLACSGYEGVVPVPVATAQSALPEGYTATSQDGVQGAEGRVHYVWVGCDFFQTASSTIPNVTYGYVAVDIEAPAGHDGANRYLLRMLVQDDLMNTLWDVAGYERYVGEFVRFSNGIPDVPAPAIWEVHQGDYQAQMATTMSFADDVEPVTFHTIVDEGTLVWTGEVVAHAFHGATGILSVPADDPFAGSIDPFTGAQAEQRIFTHVDFTGNDLWLQ